MPFRRTLCMCARFQRQAVASVRGKRTPIGKQQQQLYDLVWNLCASVAQGCTDFFFTRPLLFQRSEIVYSLEPTTFDGRHASSPTQWSRIKRTIEDEPPR